METIKCNSCGAVQEKATEISKCDFCGNNIDLQTSKDFYKETNSGETGNLMAMADIAIEATNWDEALQFYNKVLEKEITNADAWLGKGIAVVYTSKIGELKINEAITYWKNAIKNSTNKTAMGKRVAKEINIVVKSFYPSLENHFVQFKDLENSYSDLVNKFSVLEKAQDYATQIDSHNIDLYNTGYELCKKVIQLPSRYAMIDEMAGWATGIAGAFNQNKYQRQDATRQINQAKIRLQEIKNARVIVSSLENKYVENINRLGGDVKIESGIIDIPQNKSVDLTNISGYFIGGFLGIIIGGLFGINILNANGINLGEYKLLYFMLFIISGAIVGNKILNKKKNSK